jgi:hypothetical protein
MTSVKWGLKLVGACFLMAVKVVGLVCMAIGIALAFLSHFIPK